MSPCLVSFLNVTVGEIWAYLSWTLFKDEFKTNGEILKAKMEQLEIQNKIMATLNLKKSFKTLKWS